jgi:hypothetical protein
MRETGGRRWRKTALMDMPASSEMSLPTALASELEQKFSGRIQSDHGRDRRPEFSRRRCCFKDGDRSSRNLIKTFLCSARDRITEIPEASLTYGSLAGVTLGFVPFERFVPALLMTEICIR